MLDADIRPVLISDISARERDAMFIEELPLLRGNGRADLASVNGHLSGYEIKSERDSLSRLSGQIINYESVFDYSIAVVADRHLRRARQLLPRRWGIKLIAHRSSGPYIEHVRIPSRNPNPNPFALARLMWKTEGVSALRNHGIEIVDKRISVLSVWDLLVNELTLQELSAAVRKSLKARKRAKAVLPRK